MEKPIYKVMKVFDCQWDPGMPKDVKKAFFDLNECGNNVYVRWQIASDIYEEGDEWSIKRKLVDDWLIANGAEGPKDEHSSGETVLIKHWW